jgi:putative Mg2+ transporter-C (MgtC) family protein
VSGVTFLRRNVVRGLTAAASVWAVSGLGITAGPSLSVPAAVGAGFMLPVQGGLRPLERRLFRHQATQHDIVIVASHAPDAIARMRQLLHGSSIPLHSIDIDRGSAGKEDAIHLNLRTEKIDEILTLFDLLQDTAGVQSVRWKRGAAQNRDRDRGSGASGDGVIPGDDLDPS